jgi:hypothetical protein
MMQNDDMGKEAAITVRIPLNLKHELETRARNERRSLSSQIATYLERSIETDTAFTSRAPGRLIGLYSGAKVPTDGDFALARRKLWASLGGLKTKRGA